MKIDVWRNRLFDLGVVISAYSSQAVNYPAINAISTSPTQKWRTTGKTSEYISLALSINPLFSAFSGYRQAKPITITNIKGVVITNVPVMIRVINDADIGAVCRSDGYDVRFVDDDGRELSQCRLSFSVSSGQATGEFWVLIPNLPAAGKTIYCIFGNAEATDVSDSSVNPDILLDGDFEQWETDTDLTLWEETLSGSTTINKESAEKARGNHACRIDVDSNNSGYGIYQNYYTRFVRDKSYKLCLKSKSNVSGRSIYILILAIVGDVNYYFNFDTLQWQTEAIQKNFTLSTTYSLFHSYVNGQMPSGSLTGGYLRIYRNNAPSSSLYVDDAKWFKADSYDACDIAEQSWYEQESVVSWGAARGLGAYPIGRFGLFGTNLTDSATITLKLANLSDFSDAVVFNLTGSQVKDKYYDLPQSYQRYAKIEISDTGNSNTYLEIGTIWLAGKDIQIQPTQFSEQLKARDIYDESYNSIGFYLIRPSLRSWKVSARITSSDDLKMLQDIIAENTTSIPFYVESDDDPQILGHPIYAFVRFTDTPEINYVYVNYWTASADLIETR